MDEAVVRARAGDRAAFEDLIGPLVVPGYRLALGLLLAHAEADDAVQDAVLTAWRRVGTIRPGGNVRAWFLAIVTSRCRDIQRRSWWRLVRATAQPTEAAVVHDLALAENRADLHRALSGLSAPARAVIALHYYVGLTLEEVAAVVDIPVGTVKSRLHGALRQLRRELNADVHAAEVTA